MAARSYMNTKLSNAEKKQIITEVIADVGTREYMHKLKKMPGFEGMTASDVAMIYHDIDSLTCKYGEQRRFKSITNGFKYCKHGQKCKCLKDKKTSKLPKRSSEAIAASNAKREKTNLKIHGVANIGSTAKAKAAHAKFYANPDNIIKQVAKQEATMMDRYGVTNYGHTAGNIFKTENHPMKNPATAKKAGENRMGEWDGEHLNKLYAAKIKKVLEANDIVLLSEYTGINKRYEYMCSCGHSWDAVMYRSTGVICKACNPTPRNNISRGEQMVTDFVKSIYDGPMVIGSRSIISPYEIDIFLPDLNIGIEYSGLYWHSAIAGNKDEYYHQMKYSRALEQGISLITVFSDNWNDQMRNHITNAINGNMGIPEISEETTIVTDNAMGFYDIGWESYLTSPAKMYTFNYEESFPYEMGKDYIWDCGKTVWRRT